MNTTQSAVRQKTEAAIATYIRNYYDPNTRAAGKDQLTLDLVCRREGSPLNGLPIYEGETPAKFAVPCIVVNIPTSKRMTADKDTPWSVVDVEVHVLSHVEENNQGAEEDEAEEEQTDALNESAGLHADRVGAVTDLLDGVDALKLALNIPTEGDDERPVKGYSIFDLWHEGENATQYDLHWDNTMAYQVTCSPLDPETEEG